MSNLTNSTYLRNVQYQDSRNLAARAALHELFSTNQIGWHPWVYQQLDLGKGSKILEIGCGPAYFWQKNTQNLTHNWQIFLCDLSQGMLEEARASLSQFSPFRYTILNGASLPFPEGFFDAVIANHVLYHLPDISQAVREIQRVLKPGCWLYAATNGENHLQEIRAWKEKYFPGESDVAWGTPTNRFGLANGAGILAQYFHPVQLRLYPDQLEIDQVEPILRYIESYLEENEDRSALDGLRKDLEIKLAQKGSIRISKETGLFLAEKPSTPM
jgi:SAM-dependent methyltransferase